MRRQSGAGALAALILTCVFGATLLLSLATGASVYRRVAGRTERIAQDRVSVSYIAAKVHAADAAGGIEAGSFGDGGAVFLYEDIEGVTYETVLYVCNGALMEMLCEKGFEPDPEFGETVCAAQALEVSSPEPGLLYLTLTGPDGIPQSAGLYVRSDG